MAGHANVQTCSTHRGASAIWLCLECERRLCPDCAVRHEDRTVVYESCWHCDGQVRRLTRAGSLDSFSTELRRTWLMPVGLLWTLTAWGVCWLIAGVPRYLALGPLAAVLVLGGAAYWTLSFAIVRSSAEDPGYLETVRAQDLKDRVVIPAIRAWVVGTAVGLIWIRIPLPRGVLAIVLPILAYLAPAWIIALSRGESLHRALGPKLVLDYSKRLGSDYAMAVCAVAAVIGFSACMSFAAETGRLAGIALLPRVLRTVALYALLLIPRVLGLLLHARAEAVDYPLASDRQVPVMPGVDARAPPRPKEILAPAPKVRREAIAIDDLDTGPLELETLTPERRKPS